MTLSRIRWTSKIVCQSSTSDSNECDGRESEASCVTPIGDHIEYDIRKSGPPCSTSKCNQGNCDDRECETTFRVTAGDQDKLVIRGVKGYVWGLGKLSQRARHQGVQGHMCGKGPGALGKN
ncbi:hypothetical protein ACTXT7_010291 [Hymenolepis weldensis]